MSNNVDYKFLNDSLRALIQEVPHLTANLANASALLYNSLENLNWAGFYLMKSSEKAMIKTSDPELLVLGPFQGQTACIEIPVGKGVCGTAVAANTTQLVYDVHQFPGHIACDSASNSEIVVPIRIHGRIVGVLDIDSPSIGRFSKEDQEGLEAFVRVLEEETENIW